LGAIAHNAETLLTGENVRSYPATAVVDWRELRAMNEDSSRGFAGARPYCSVNMSRPTSVRIRARSAAASGVSRGIPEATFTSTARRATSTRNAGAVSRTSYLLPSWTASRAAWTCAGVLPRLIIRAWMASAFGCRPSANRAPIWPAVTGSPTCMPTSASADPNQVPGDSPSWV